MQVSISLRMLMSMDVIIKKENKTAHQCVLPILPYIHKSEATYTDFEEGIVGDGGRLLGSFKGQIRIMNIPTLAQMTS